MESYLVFIFRRLKWLHVYLIKELPWKLKNSKKSKTRKFSFGYGDEHRPQANSLTTTMHCIQLRGASTSQKCSPTYFYQANYSSKCYLLKDIPPSPNHFLPPPEFHPCPVWSGHRGPGGWVVKNPPANAGDLGSIPGLGRCHMARSTKTMLQNSWAHMLPVSEACAPEPTWH